MIDPDHIPPVDDEELLARYIVRKSEYRSDGLVKPGLFMPWSRSEISVNRHLECKESEIWQVGRHVAAVRQCELQGRCDIAASACRIPPLKVVPQPLSDNPNHAGIIDFPTEKKEDQKSLAMKLAAAASKRIVPPSA